LKIGLSAFYTGNRLAGWNNLKDANGNQKTNRMYEIGDYTTVDFSIGYQAKKFSIMGKIGNLFDVVDYNVHENYSVNPITPRNFYLTINYKL
jgi:iron complex outermembrane receptor protein